MSKPLGLESIFQHYDSNMSERNSGLMPFVCKLTSSARNVWCLETNKGAILEQLSSFLISLSTKTTATALSDYPGGFSEQYPAKAPQTQLCLH